MPKAHSTEASRGTICSGISSSLQIRQPWIGPAPPPGISGNSRGSKPRLIVTSRTPCAMLLQATRYMPAAACSIDRPIGLAMCSSMARRAAAPVAGRAGISAGALWAHAQQPALVEPADRAAAGANGVDVQHRQRDAVARDLA